MSEARYVVLGVAHVRSAWFTEVARWSTSGVVPIEFVKCLSPTELRAHAARGRSFSAALLDATLPAVDRDLIHHLARHHIPALVVAGPVPDRAWADLGAAAVLTAHLAPAELLDALVAQAEPIHPTTAATGAPFAVVDPVLDDATAPGPLIAVVGRSGAGASTIAVALAQELADRVARAPDALGPMLGGAAAGCDRPVVLADLALHAHQAVLHDAGDVLPGLPELVDAQRDGTPSAADVLATTYDVPRRGYRLLLGLRRHAGWTALPARSLRAGIDGLRRAAAVVVADVDPDVEGEAETGSFDVEDRNHLARMAVQHAQVVVVVCRPHLTGIHGLVVLLGDLRAAGLDAQRVVVVVNGAPRLPRRRADLARTIGTLAQGSGAPTSALAAYGALAFVPERRGLDDLHLAVARLPNAIARPVGHAVLQVLDQAGSTDPGTDAPPAVDDPKPVRVRELGHWSDEDLG